MAAQSTKDRLAELGYALPSPPKPVAAYVGAVVTGPYIYTSGQIPFRDGDLIATGRVPSQASLEQAYEAARQCVLNALAIIDDAAPGGLDSILRIIRLGVFVASDPDFNDQPKVANGASELLQDLFGENGRHTRAAVGAVALPLGATVEVELLAELAG